MKLSAAQERVLTRLYGGDVLSFLPPPGGGYIWRRGEMANPQTVHVLWKQGLVAAVDEQVGATYELTDEGRALAKKLREEG